MILERDVKKVLSEQLTSRINQSDFKPWYIGYYSEISETTFRSYLKAHRLPNPITLIMIAELFKCSVNDLLGYESYRFIKRERIFDSWLDTPKVTKYFWDRIFFYMHERNIRSLDFLAWRSYVGSFTVQYDFEKNILPELITILRICDTLECTPSDLLGY